MLNKLYKPLFLMVVIFQTLQAGESPAHILLQGQSALMPYLMWDEIQQDEIQYGYYLPAMERPSPYPSMGAFYQNWLSRSDIPISLRLHADLLTQNGQGARQVIQGTAQLQLSERISFQNDFEFDSDGYADSHFRGAKTQAFGDWTFYAQNATISYIYEQGHFVAGRGNVFTSVFGESVLLNQNYTPAENLWWHHTVSKLSFDWVVTSLEPVNGNNRFLTLHRYAYEANRWRIGFSEMVMVDYISLGAPQIRYLMPASIFYETEVNGGSNNNMMWAFDFIKKLRKMTLNGELLVDDYALDKGTPPKLAVKLGIGYTHALADVYAEYVRVNRWTGNFYDPELRFVENGTLIGSPLGPDSHGIRILVFKEVKDRFFTNLTLRWTESGSGNIDEWPDYIGNSANFGYNSEPFPSRPISTEYQAQLKLDYFYNAHLNAAMSMDVSSSKGPVFQFHLRFAL
ncbi:MAG: hypothetical protein K9N35_01295 [Candidatus Marinimicrobia bacterium]|nr:hypothetical protein [Candidatus Neomarinimicrobiota bacterium]